jgi:hypothetical protein
MGFGALSAMMARSWLSATTLTYLNLSMSLTFISGYLLLLLELFIAFGEGVMQVFGLQQTRFRGILDVPRTPFLEPRQKLIDTH